MGSDGGTEPATYLLTLIKSYTILTMFGFFEKSFTAADIPDQTGRNVIVTGANTGGFGMMGTWLNGLISVCRSRIHYCA